jgi:hypothetical protein
MERRPVNAYAIYCVNQHLDSLREEAAAKRHAYDAVDPQGPSLRDRVASAVDKVRRGIARAGEGDYSFMPKIHDYPYRA